MRGKCIGVMLLLIAAGAAAQQTPGDLSGYLPAGAEVSGWTLSEAPKTCLGDKLYEMINGGADIYHEYGFTQVMRADYVNGRGTSIKLEIFEMESPAAAYGIYTFKIGAGGKATAIGQEALLEDYYLNFWKADLLVTVIGPDSQAETVQGVIALSKAVDARITKTGKRPELADLLLREPLAFSNPKFVRGSLGIMNSYIFDTEDIFGVREGLIGAVGDCQAFVFRYADSGQSAGAFANAAARLRVSPRFKNFTLQENQCAMAGREKEFLVIHQTGRHIAIVIGQTRDKVASTSDRLVVKLKNG